MKFLDFQPRIDENSPSVDIGRKILKLSRTEIRAKQIPGPPFQGDSSHGEVEQLPRAPSLYSNPGGRECIVTSSRNSYRAIALPPAHEASAESAYVLKKTHRVIEWLTESDAWILPARKAVYLSPSIEYGENQLRSSPLDGYSAEGSIPSSKILVSILSSLHPNAASAGQARSLISV